VSYRLIDHEPEGRTDKVSAMRGHSVAEARLPLLATGRALQAGFEQMEDGLALLYPALAWSICAPGHHGYPRASDLILRKALRGRWCHQITDATARPFLHLLNPTRRPRQV
jgi:hypothetical protein